MFGLGAGELILVLLAFPLLFGAKRLPSLARGLGEGISEFKKSLRAGDDGRRLPEPESGAPVAGNI